MRVAHFTFEYPPSTTGGLGTYLQGLVKYQRSVGDVVDIYFLDEREPPPGTLSLPFYPGGVLQAYTLSDIQARQPTAEYDVVVCQDWAGILASRPLWRRTASLVMTCHLPLAWDLGYYDDLPCQFAGELEFFALAQADGIIAVSEAVRKHLVEAFPFVQDRVRVVANGTDTNYFSPAADVSQSTVLYVGRFFEQKGADLIPRIFAEVKRRRPQQRFVVIGTGPLKDSILADLHICGLMDSLDFFDFAPQDKVLALYRDAKVVVMPSRREPFGLVATESMATGTPLVAASVGGLQEIVTDGHDGLLVASEDVEGFANAIISLLEDESLAARIGASGRQTAVQRYDQRVCYENTRQAYRAAAGLE